MRSGDPLISVADERKRERILTRDEENRLLAACENRYQRHLRPILICALDTGMRRGEILGLKWSDVEFEERVLTIRAFNMKTMKERQVSLTIRLAIELEKLWDESPKDKDQLVFGFTNGLSGSGDHGINGRYEGRSRHSRVAGRGSRRAPTEGIRD
jgi:integrase